ncbi:MFS transporter [Gordonia polyisoprenivorans]|uniref:MFS transporter n=1 Tax=Gordonia polyisoprenivorans TaxID=84595 RepID=UPI001B8B879F|nr:MFS transporter [Gordonia polyisoprenivorans]QUD84128.1 MFS transporter [Gordonia polyisoprenivorans]
MGLARTGGGGLERLVTSPPQPSGDFPRALALLGAGAMFMEILDATIVVTALPSIAAGFGVGALDAAGVVTAYLITLAVLIPLSSWIAERFGVRRVFVLALVVFTLASVGCALAPSLPVLIGMRVVQAAGGAMMVPIGRLAVLRAVSVGHVARAIAYLTWPALVAPVVAPLLGGLIVEHASWQVIFVLNIPIGIIGVVAALRILRPDVGRPVRRLDVVGALGTMVAVGAAMTVAEVLSATPVRWVIVVAGLVVAIVVGVGTVVHLRSARDPLLNLAVLRIHSFASVIGYGTAYRLAISAVPFVVPLMLQVHFGWSPVTAGAMVTALFAGNVVIKPLTTPLMRRWGIRRVLLVVSAASVVTFVALAAVGAATPAWLLALVLVVSGMLRSIGFSAYNTLAFADVGEVRLGDANALHAAVQELGNAFGVALASMAIALLGTTAAVLPAGAYSAVFVILAVVMVVCAVGASALPSRVGAHALGTR